MLVANKSRTTNQRSTKTAASARARITGLRFSDPVVKVALAVFLVGSVAVIAVFAHYYLEYDRIIDRRLAGHLFSNSARIYARSQPIDLGQKVDLDDIAFELQRAGYGEAGKSNSQMGTYHLLKNAIEIHPGPQSFQKEDGAIVTLKNGVVDSITGLDGLNGKALSEFRLEPLLITSLETQDRAKRRLVQYKDIPKLLVNAVTSIEDRRFFHHSGVNFFRLTEAAYTDLVEGDRGQGGSTLTMQVARFFFLNYQKTLKRKASEILIALELEQKLTKEQIFEVYANMVPQGQRGSYTINGFAEGARAYFNKDLDDLTLPEAALLAGMVQRPSYLNPYRHPERALNRRNAVLDAMVETGAVTREEAKKAKAAPLNLAPPNVEASDAPYFIDLVKDRLLSKYNERDLSENSYRIYTTLDPDLQRAAAEAVQTGLKGVDAQIERRRTRRVRVGKGRNAKIETKILDGPQAQVALVAMDPRTGEVLALVGGRNYGFSQLDHAIARRPMGSVFKPFVYASAMNSALGGNVGSPAPATASAASTAVTPANAAVTPSSNSGAPGDGTSPVPAVWTPASILDDEPTTFTYGDPNDPQFYTPRHFKEEYFGQVSASFALAHSLNNATIKLAEEVGYDNVATLAHAAGLASVQPTPAMAIGAYDATPLEVAGAYTIFANGGVRISPRLLESLRDNKGNPIESFQSDKTPVLDPRIAYVMTTMMEGVMNRGSGYTVRTMGFTAPAAGKTGTENDGWFAGYTSNLLCIVWVGFDDYRDLGLTGSAAAAPIWAEFMKQAGKLWQYSDAQEFQAPPGVVDVSLDKVTNRLATPSCPDDYSVAFIYGTEPHETCDQVDNRGFFSRILGLGSPQPQAPAAAGPAAALPHPHPPGRPATQPPAHAAASATPNAPQPSTDADDQGKKKGIFGKIFGIFKGDDSDSGQQKDQQRRR
jgi:penicillin-binding protein 1B